MRGQTDHFPLFLIEKRCCTGKGIAAAGIAGGCGEGSD